MFKNIYSGESITYILDENDFKILETIPGYWHEVENISNKELKVLVWANEIFDEKKPDTYRHY